MRQLTGTQIDMAGRCGVLFFLLLSKNADLSGYIHTNVGKRTAFGFFISQINEKNGESENEGYEIYYCR
jgi:hypothetical protein